MQHNALNLIVCTGVEVIIATPYSTDLDSTVEKIHGLVQFLVSASWQSLAESIDVRVLRLFSRQIAAEFGGWLIELGSEREARARILATPPQQLAIDHVDNHRACAY